MTKRRERRKFSGYDFRRLLKQIREATADGNSALSQIIAEKEDCSLTSARLAILLGQAATAIGFIWLPLREIESIAEHNTQQMEEMKRTIGRLERAVAELERQLEKHDQ